MTTNNIPVSIPCTRTSQKKVTHVLTIKGTPHYCTSAGHVCEVLESAGMEISPAVIYRACSTCKKRVHKRTIPFPDGVSVVRVPKEPIQEPTPALAPVPSEQRDLFHIPSHNSLFLYVKLNKSIFLTFFSCCKQGSISASLVE